MYLIFLAYLCQELRLIIIKPNSHLCGRLRITQNNNESQ